MRMSVGRSTKTAGGAPGGGRAAAKGGGHARAGGGGRENRPEGCEAMVLYDPGRLDSPRRLRGNRAHVFSGQPRTRRRKTDAGGLALDQRQRMAQLITDVAVVPDLIHAEREVEVV